MVSQDSRLDAARAALRAALALLDGAGEAPAATTSTVYYTEESSPTKPTSRRAWREWLHRHEIASTRAGGHLLAPASAVDAVLASSAKRPAPKGEADEDDLANVLARHGMRIVGGGR